MCGIAGYINLDGAPAQESILRAMTGVLVHRGPDGAGYYCQDNIGLAMRRLSIIDVAGSDQPLYNEDQSLVLVFNGEIYNYQDHRQRLQAQGHRFHTQGDGESIVHLYEEHSRSMPRHLRGQFALALWDSDQRRLLLARDVTGQKPLYFYHDERVFVFASEIKSLLVHPSVPRVSRFEGDPSALAMFLGYGYIPAPETPFKDIHMLKPGHLMTIEPDLISHQGAYYEIPPFAPADNDADVADYLDPLREHLLEAVRLRLIADVPLGAFLSGGLDSSLIVALMQEAGNQQVKTFSIGFEGDSSFDETPCAEQVAQHLGTDHTAFHVAPDALDLLPKLVWHLDAPFADSSVIPTFLVSQLTRQQVTVALTGDGGDELFAGYERFYAASLVQQMRVVPRALWRWTASGLGQLPEGTGYYNLIKRAGRFARGASQPLDAAYFDWVRLFDSGQIHDLTGADDHALAHFRRVHLAYQPDLARILHANMTSYLPDDLLIKTDRCSMAASLEARAPFLDHHLIDHAARIPLNLKLRGRTTKYILKTLARDYLPDSIIDRKKHGFGVPLGTWLREDIAPVREILLSERARQRGLFDQGAVETLITEHETRQRDHGFRLWTLLTLEWWHRLFIDSFDPDQHA